ncbi:hypothetical protein [Rhizomonospora bruguierae]|uniref:hypothetical protein n=1 Tax=Rhizomonospora bruguierae TaxID=1581705 RepID=UPI001BCD96A0|nr:hypothetical protein [Micromonospora sp. NBRC 107566]
MQHATNTGDAHIRPYGALTLMASRTVDGGYAVNVFVGAERESELCFTSADRAYYRARYGRIARLALAGQTAENIALILAAEEAAVIAAAEEAVSPAGLAAIARPKPQVRPTMAGAHLIGFISDAVFHALEIAEREGRVRRGLTRDGRAPFGVLNSAARKGLLKLTPAEGARHANWAFGELTAVGRNVLADERARRARETRKAGAR